MDHGVKRLDPTTEHFGAAGEVSDLGDGKARFADGAGGAAGTDEVPAEVVESTREVDDAALVVDGEDRAHELVPSISQLARRVASRGGR